MTRPVFFFDMTLVAAWVARKTPILCFFETEERRKRVFSFSVSRLVFSLSSSLSLPFSLSSCTVVTKGRRKKERRAKERKREREKGGKASLSLFLPRNPQPAEQKKKRKKNLTSQVRPDHVVPLLPLHPQHQSVPRDPGVVHQDVDRAPLGDGLVDQALDVLSLAQIGADDDRVAARGLDLGRDLLSGPRGRSVVDDDAGSRGSQGERDGAADAAGGARDDADGGRGS
jgi:hypothetical protein